MLCKMQQTVWLNETVLWRLSSIALVLVVVSRLFGTLTDPCTRPIGRGDQLERGYLAKCVSNTVNYFW